MKVTSNYNSEDFIIQALSDLVLPPGGSRWAEFEIKNIKFVFHSNKFILRFKVLFLAAFWNGKT